MRQTIYLAAAVTFLTASAAIAAPVVLSQPAAGAQELTILSSFFGERDPADMRTAIVDVNLDEVPEIFVRYQGADDCAAEGVCRTAALRFMGNDWKVVFEANAAAIELGAPGFGGIKAIVADGVTYSWSSDRYAMDVSSSGVPVAFAPAPAESAELLVYQFGEGALQLFRKKTAVTIEISAAELGSGSSQVIAKLGGPGVCGTVMGCPVRVLDVVDGQYRVLMEGFSSGDVIVSASDRDGWKDIVTGMPKSGHAVYGWDGERYGVAEMNIGK